MDYSIAGASNSRSFRFSGHETFAFRYAWLPKAYRLLQQDQSAFSHEDNAMIELGLGKNMVRSLRFWVEATGLAQPATGRGIELTDFARAVFDPQGFDPYLEDSRTLWAAPLESIGAHGRRSVRLALSAQPLAFSGTDPL